MQATISDLGSMAVIVWLQVFNECKDVLRVKDASA